MVRAVRGRVREVASERALGALDATWSFASRRTLPARIERLKIIAFDVQ